VTESDIALKLVQVMRTVIASADRQGKPAVMHFGQPKKEAIQTGALNIDGHKLLDNVGGEAFDYGSFKAAYDTDARVKTMTANFNKDSITLKTSKEADKPADAGKSGTDTVAKMASREVDLSPAAL
tara:strand:+ start:137 stop:514 length:378 start_codon:yes stop_codon:yes gene_type:complete